MMDWLEIIVAGLDEGEDREAIEKVVELFNRWGQGGAVVELPVLNEEQAGAARLVVKTYLPPDEQDRLQRLERELAHLRRLYGIPAPQLRHLGRADWAEAWKAQYRVLHIGQRLVIRPSWLSYTPQPGEVVLTLDPGMAFGTGLHASTRLCLAALERCLRPGDALLDVGTGSGILAIAAARLGAGAVLALDVDPLAVRVARENAALNGVAEIVEVRQGSLPVEPSAGWDIIVVNILAETIARMAPALAAHLATGGLLIASGVLAWQEQLLSEALAAQGFVLAERWREEDWLALACTRGG
jgi:ribosomal protein L11 methyltransferase